MEPHNYEHERFKMIYWFVFWVWVISFGYIAAITFMPIPKENIRFADTMLGFVVGTALTGGLAYLTGGSPAQVLKKSTTPATTETTMKGVTAEVITTGDTNTEKKDNEKKDETNINNP